jgi:hypothetical protein
MVSPETICLLHKPIRSIQLTGYIFAIPKSGIILHCWSKDHTYPLFVPFTFFILLPWVVLPCPIQSLGPLVPRHISHSTTTLADHWNNSLRYPSSLELILELLLQQIYSDPGHTKLEHIVCNSLQLFLHFWKSRKYRNTM